MPNRNNTFIKYSSGYRLGGKWAQISSKYVANYGEQIAQFSMYNKPLFCSGSGSFSSGHTLDADTIQVAAIVTPVAGSNGENIKTNIEIATHTKNNVVYNTEDKLAGEFQILNEYNKGNEDPDLTIDITPTPIDGGLELVKGQCKRIVFSYYFPKDLKRHVTHYAEVKDATPGKYVTWCGFYLKKVDHLQLNVFFYIGCCLGWEKFSLCYT